MQAVRDVPRLVLPVAYGAAESENCGPLRAAAFPAVLTDKRAWGLTRYWSVTQRRAMWRLLAEVRAW
jgi:hypothetical protein